MFDPFTLIVIDADVDAPAYPNPRLWHIGNVLILVVEQVGGFAIEGEVFLLAA